MDLLYEKIPNTWICSAYLMGFLYQMVTCGLSGIAAFLLGAFLPVLLLFVLFCCRMLGAGDIKLLSALGGVMGAIPVLRCTLVSFAAGGVLSLLLLLACGGLVTRLQYFLSYCRAVFAARRLCPYRQEGSRAEHIHFSIPILIGALFYVGGLYG